MDVQKLAIATVSWARDRQEEELLRLSLRQLSSLNIPVFITDAGSPPAFINYIKQLEHFTVLRPEKKGLWTQAATSMQQAVKSGATFIFYTEPDKLDFFKLLPKLLADIEADEKTGVILAARTALGLASYPPFQQMTETAINNCCAEITGLHVDYTYGPFLLNSKIVAYLMALPEDIGWGWRTYAFNIAARLRLKITAYAGDYRCNADQQADDSGERIYRMKQLTQNIQGLVLSASTDVPSLAL